MRQLDGLAEQQNKMSKVLQGLTKSVQVLRKNKASTDEGTEVNDAQNNGDMLKTDDTDVKARVAAPAPVPPVPNGNPSDEKG